MHLTDGWMDPIASQFRQILPSVFLVLVNGITIHPDAQVSQRRNLVVIFFILFYFIYFGCFGSSLLLVGFL